MLLVKLLILQGENVAYTFKPAGSIGLEKHKLCCKEPKERSELISSFMEKYPQLHRENGGRIFKNPQNLIIGGAKEKPDRVIVFKPHSMESKRDCNELGFHSDPLAHNN